METTMAQSDCQGSQLKFLLVAALPVAVLMALGPTGRAWGQQTERLATKESVLATLPAELKKALDPTKMTASFDGGHLAWVAEDKEGGAIILDGQRLKTYQWVGCPQFSPDGKRQIGRASCRERV